MNNRQKIDKHKNDMVIYNKVRKVCIEVVTYMRILRTIIGFFSKCLENEKI